MLEETGRVNYLKRLSWRFTVEQHNMIPHIRRLVKLGPVLDEFEIIGGGAENYDVEHRFLMINVDESEFIPLDCTCSLLVVWLQILLFNLVRQLL